MTCNQVEARLSAYLDQELSRSEMASVRVHLHECETCAQALADMNYFKEFVNQRPEPELPVGLEDRLMRAVFEEPARAPRRFALAWAGSAAFVVAFVLAWGWLQSTDAQQTDLKNQVAHSDFNLARDQAYAAGGDPFAGNTVILTSSHGAR